jgi:hypothetical protein
MYRSLENRSAANGLTFNLLKGNSDIVSKIPALEEDTAELGVLNLQLKDLIRKYENESAGKTAEKQKAESALLDAVRPIKAKLLSYTHRHPDEALAQLAGISMSDLRNMRDAEFLRYALTLHDKATALAGPLGHYGLTQAMLDTLKTAREAFDNSIGDRDGSNADKTGTYTKIDALTAQINDLLNKGIDPLVESMEKDFPAFAASYFATRTVRDHGLRHRKPDPPPAETDNDKE